MQQRKTTWIVLVVIIILVALGLWWLAASQSIDTSTGVFARIFGGGSATTTEPGTQTNTQGTSGSTVVDRRSSDVAAIAQNISGSSTFGSWLASTGVAAQLKGAGPYTVFVPTDGAISQLPAGTFSNLSAAEKKRFVQYHIISGRAIDVDAMTAGGVQALSGDSLNFSFGANQIPMVNSAITITAYRGSNGIVYVIDNVLVPPKKQPIL